MNKLTKKIIIFSILFFVFIFPLEIKASWLGEEDAILSANLATNLENTITTGLNAESNYLMQYKEFIGDTLAYVINQTLMEELSNETILAINTGGENGNTSYVYNLDRYLSNKMDKTAIDFIKNSVKGLDSSFRADVQKALLKSYKNSIDEKNNPQSTIENVDQVIEDLDKNWSWTTYLEITTNPYNNPFGAYYESSGSLAQNVEGTKKIESQKLDQGSGFTNKEECEEIEVEDSTTENPSEGYWEPTYHTETVCKTKTPGVTLWSSLTNTLDLGNKALTQVDEIEEVVGAIITQIITQAINEGISELTETNDEGYTYFDYEFDLDRDESEESATSTLRKNVELALEAEKEFLEIKFENLEFAIYIENSLDSLCTDCGDWVVPWAADKKDELGIGGLCSGNGTIYYGGIQTEKYKNKTSTFKEVDRRNEEIRESGLNECVFDDDIDNYKNLYGVGGIGGNGGKPVLKNGIIVDSFDIVTLDDSLEVLLADNGDSEGSDSGDDSSDDDSEEADIGEDDLDDTSFSDPGDPDHSGTNTYGDVSGSDNVDNENNNEDSSGDSESSSADSDISCNQTKDDIIDDIEKAKENIEILEEFLENIPEEGPTYNELVTLSDEFSEISSDLFGEQGVTTATTQNEKMEDIIDEIDEKADDCWSPSIEDIMNGIMDAIEVIIDMVSDVPGFGGSTKLIDIFNDSMGEDLIGDSSDSDSSSESDGSETGCSVSVSGESGNDIGRTNGNRPTFRFSKPGSSYCGGGACSAVVSCQNSGSATYSIPSASSRYSSGGFLWKPVSESDGNLVILLPSSSN